MKSWPIGKNRDRASSHLGFKIRDVTTEVFFVSRRKLMASKGVLEHSDTIIFFVARLFKEHEILQKLKSLKNIQRI